MIRNVCVDGSTDKTAHHHFLTRRGWIFDLDGTLTLPAHDFPVTLTALGMTESDSDPGLGVTQPHFHIRECARRKPALLNLVTGKKFLQKESESMGFPTASIKTLPRMTFLLPRSGPVGSSSTLSA